MKRHSPCQGQSEIGFVGQNSTQVPIVPTKLSKTVAKNRCALDRFLADVFTGNTFDLTKEEVDRCNVLSAKMPKLMSDKELAIEVQLLAIRTSLHPNIPKWAKIALLEYRRLHGLLSE